MHTQVKYNRLLCMILIISILVLGIFCEEKHTYSSFLRTQSLSFTNTVSMFPAQYNYPEKSCSTMESTLTHCFLLKQNVLAETGEFLLARLGIHTQINMRMCQFFFSYILVISIFLLIALMGAFFYFFQICVNLCCLRILTYIHHKDGKKSTSHLIF